MRNNARSARTTSWRRNSEWFSRTLGPGTRDHPQPKHLGTYQLKERMIVLYFDDFQCSVITREVWIRIDNFYSKFVLSILDTWGLKIWCSYKENETYEHVGIIVFYVLYFNGFRLQILPIFESNYRNMHARSSCVFPSQGDIFWQYLPCFAVMGFEFGSFLLYLLWCYLSIFSLVPLLFFHR